MFLNAGIWCEDILISFQGARSAVEDAILESVFFTLERVRIKGGGGIGQRRDEQATR